MRTASIRGYVTMNVNTKIALGIAAAATGVGAVIGIPMIVQGLQEEHKLVPTDKPSQDTGFHLPEVGIGVQPLVDTYMKMYDHGQDGRDEIDISSHQAPGAGDERTTGDPLDKHTMVEFFKKADTDGDERVTRKELYAAIAVYDTQGTFGFNPNSKPLGDGYLGPDELARFRNEAIRAYSDTLTTVDDRGVPMMITKEDGSQVNNSKFFESLPEYGPRYAR